MFGRAKETGGLPGFKEFKISKRVKQKMPELKNTIEDVDWKLQDIKKSALPYSDAFYLQENELQKKGAERLSSINIFLRADHYSPEEIILERKGFHPHPTISGEYGRIWNDHPAAILNIGSHRISSKNTGFVSCTDSIEVIKTFNYGSNAYFYMVKAAGAISPGFITANEREYSVPGGIDADDIIAFREYQKESFNGSLYIRKSFIEKYGDYVNRIFSVYMDKDELISPNISLEEKSQNNTPFTPNKNAFFSKENFITLIWEVLKQIAITFLSFSTPTGFPLEIFDNKKSDVKKPQL